MPLNLCFEALDRPIIHGRADEAALTVGGKQVTYARLLAETGAMAGVLQMFDAGPDDRVLVQVGDSYVEFVAVLAAWRLGCGADVFRACDPQGTWRIGVVDEIAQSASAESWIVAGEIQETGPDRIDLATALRAGKTNPAGAVHDGSETPLRIDGVLTNVEDGDDALATQWRQLSG